MVLIVHVLSCVSSRRLRMFPRYIGDPSAALSQLPQSPPSQGPSNRGPPFVVVASQPGGSIDHVPRHAIVADARPIRVNPSGRYNLSFFDGENEFENIGHHPHRLHVVSAQRPQAGSSLPPTTSNSTPALTSSHLSAPSIAPPTNRSRYEDFLQRLVSGAFGPALSDAAFEREYSYERLVELDSTVSSRNKGLLPSEMYMTLVSSQTTNRRRYLAANGNTEPHECVICIDEACSSPSRDSGTVQSFAVLHCLHAFHVDCIKKWLTCAFSCPVCRSDVRNGEGGTGEGGH